MHKTMGVTILCPVCVISDDVSFCKRKSKNFTCNTRWGKNVLNLTE